MPRKPAGARTFQSKQPAEALGCVTASARRGHWPGELAASGPDVARLDAHAMGLIMNEGDRGWRTRRCCRSATWPFVDGDSRRTLSIQRINFYPYIVQQSPDRAGGWHLYFSKQRRPQRFGYIFFRRKDFSQIPNSTTIFSARLRSTSPPGARSLCRIALSRTCRKATKILRGTKGTVCSKT